MNRTLDIGAGPRSQADVQIDLFKWNDRVVVQDIVDTPWKVDGEFSEIRCEQVLEHIPTVSYFEKDGHITHIYPRIIVMKEIHRLLLPHGIAHISVPITDEAFRQDPTHVAPRVTSGQFNYFCGQWGGGTPGEFVNDAYGINFKFKKVEERVDGFILTVRLEKVL